MTFLHPGLLWLSPLVAAPILIHLLNRIRYRVVRWAAIDFLLANERRAVRRARLRQILLMVLRTLLLAAAILALAQPVFRGSIAALLGGSSRLAVVIDASASMSAGDASGTAFDRAKDLAAGTVKALPTSTRVAAGTFATRYNCPFGQPLSNRRAVAALMDAAYLTSGPANVPGAIRSAAEALRRSGGGGTIWLLTDMQADGWRAEQAGAWRQVRRELDQAGSPLLVVTDVSPKVESNLSVAAVRVVPPILMSGDEPKLIVTVTMIGRQTAVAAATLFLDGRRVDSRSVKFASPGKAEVAFRLPPLTDHVLTGRVELSPDAMPADDRRHFIIRTTDRVPVLLVDGAPSSLPFDGAGDFLALALQPPGSQAMGRSRFAVETIRTAQLARTQLADYAAVFLADVDRLSDKQAAELEGFVSRGGLAMVFAGPRCDVASWNSSSFPGVRIESLVEAEDGKPIRVNWTSPNSPVVADLPTEGLERLAISRLYKFAPGPDDEVLATTDNKLPLVLRRQIGKGKVYVFAVSCQADFSNLPFTPLLLLTTHRAALNHLIDRRRPLALSAFDELRFSLPGGSHSMRTPDGRMLPVTAVEGRPTRATFAATEISGIYRLVQGAEDAGQPVAAINVPAGESTLERIDPGRIRALLGEHSVSFLSGDGQGGRLEATDRARVATSSFPLAAAAIVLLLGEVMLAWSIGRGLSRAGKADAGDEPQVTKANQGITRGG